MGMRANIYVKVYVFQFSMKMKRLRKKKYQVCAHHQQCQTNIEMHASGNCQIKYDTIILTAAVSVAAAAAAKIFSFSIYCYSLACRQIKHNSFFHYIIAFSKCEMRYS